MNVKYTVTKHWLILILWIMEETNLWSRSYLPAKSTRWILLLISLGMLSVYFACNSSNHKHHDDGFFEFIH